MSKCKLIVPVVFGLINGIACVPVIMFGAMVAIDFFYPAASSFYLIDIFFSCDIIVLQCSAIALVNGILAAFAHRNSMSAIAFVLFVANVGVALLWPA